MSKLFISALLSALLCHSTSAAPITFWDLPQDVRILFAQFFVSTFPKGTPDKKILSYRTTMKAFGIGVTSQQTVLNLEKHLIDPSQVATLVRIFPRLEHLKVRFHSLTPEAVRSLGKLKLKTLKLKGGIISNETFVELAQLKTLEKLILANDSYTEEGLFQFLENRKDLPELFIAAPKISSHGEVEEIQRKIETQNSPRSIVTQITFIFKDHEGQMDGRFFTLFGSRGPALGDSSKFAEWYGIYENDLISYPTPFYLKTESP